MLKKLSFESGIELIFSINTTLKHSCRCSDHILSLGAYWSSRRLCDSISRF